MISAAIGDVVHAEMPYSEVCMFLRVAGKALWVEVLPYGAQLYRDGRPFSFPITHDEAGIKVA